MSTTRPHPVAGPSAHPSLRDVVWAARDRPGLAVLHLGPSRVRVSWCSQPSPPVLVPLAQLDQALAERPPGGGVVGHLCYESGAAFERMPPPKARPDLPLSQLWPVDGKVEQARPGGPWVVSGSPGFVAAARAVLAASQRTAPALPEAGGPLPDPAAGVGAAYRAAVRAALGEISAGNVYQVNLAWEHTGTPVAHPVRTWLALQEANPAWRGALLRCPQGDLLCNSPELFLQVEAGTGDRRVRSCPIKGTARRSGGAAARQRLLRSQKERAELTMIVDLVRNDLGRVCAVGSVQAGQRRLRACGDLWHAEQEVSGQLPAGVGPRALLAATFPPGSVTGAPKVRAMELIGALERGPRGAYTGALGWFGADGSMDLAVAIRTVTVQQGRARFHVGAGIVADSDPEAEWQETLAKGGAMARALAGPSPVGAVHR